MKAKIILKSDFSRNVVTLMTGTTVAQAIPIALSPVLTRIYTPQEFGVLAVFISIVAILASVVNGRYELAIGLPESDDEAINIAALGMLIAIVVTIFSFLFVFIFNEKIVGFFKKEELTYWLYWIPLSVFLVGLFNVLTYLNNREKNFKDIAVANVYRTAVQGLVQIILGFTTAGAAGLIVGQISSQIATIFRLCKKIFENKKNEKILSVKSIRYLARRYSSFPKYSMWAGLFNALSHNLANIFISIIFSSYTLGLHYLVQKVLGAPISLISSAIGQVFLQEATIERRKYKHAKKTFNKTVSKLFLIGLPIFVLLYLSAEYLFGVFFGEDWEIAGEYAAILTPLFFVRFIVSPVSMMNVIFEKNHVGFYWQMGLFVLSTSILLFAYFLEVSFSEYLYLNSIFISLYYLLLLGIMFTYNNISEEEV